MMKKLGFKILFLLIFSQLYCQNSIKGKVVDSKSKESLAFVNIRLNGKSNLAISTDINGKFSFTSAERIKTMDFYYLGYQHKKIELDSLNIQNDLKIELNRSDIQLQEVVIKAKENPANRIIRKVIEQREKNDPEHVSSFRYVCYNKTIYDFKTDQDPKSDSVRLKLNQTLKGGYAMVMESVTERKFMRPDLSEEKVLGTKVSGFKYPNFATIATDLQPFSFYKEILPILDINYINPISNGSLDKYYFSLEDTLYTGKDTVFIISFKPKPRKNFEGLMGSLYINTNHYALQNVIAEPFNKGLIDIKIQQHYQFVENKQWFPKELSFELTAKNYPSPYAALRMNGKSYLDSIVFFPVLHKRDFSQTALTMGENAAKRDSLFWKSYRKDSLGQREKITYRVIDSLGKENNLDALMNLMEGISRNRIPIGFVDIDFSKTFLNNRFEGQRLGLGLYTNKKLLKRISLGGFFGYGLRDKRWKYGGDLTWVLHKKTEFEIKAAYENNLLEPGKSTLDLFGPARFNWRDLIAYRMDKRQGTSFSISLRALRYAKFNMGFNHYLVDPLYNYEFRNSENLAITSYTNTNFIIGVRYAYAEKLIESLNQRISKGTDYPVLYFLYTKGFSGFKGNFNYNKIEARLEQTFLSKNLGETKLRVQAAYIDSPLPYGLLFTGEGGNDKDLPVILRNCFQTMQPYEFLSDKYVYVFFNHSFGSLLFKTPKFSPNISIQHNAAWSALAHRSAHQSLEFKTGEKGYYEAGLIMDNLIKLNTLNIVYAGLGAGIFYRYGPYAYTESRKNFFYKLSFTLTTK